MRIRENTEAELHARFAVWVVSFLLMTLQQCADYQDGVHSHLVVLITQILLRLDCQLSQSDGEAAANIVVLGRCQSSSQGVVVLWRCSFL